VRSWEKSYAVKYGKRREESGVRKESGKGVCMEDASVR